MSIPMYVPPEQLTKDRGDFARKGIARGKPLVFVEYTDGVLMLGENPSGSLHKISEIYDRIAFAGVGRFNEFETLRVAGIRYADLKGYAYGRSDVTARGLANAYAQTLGQIFTHELKPYEIEVMIAEVGPDAATTAMYRVKFDGTLMDVDEYGAMGGRDEELTQQVADRWRPDLPLDDVIGIATAAIEAVEEHSIPPDGWEAAVLDRNLGRRKFRRLTSEEIAAARDSAGAEGGQ